MAGQFNSVLSLHFGHQSYVSIKVLIEQRQYKNVTMESTSMFVLKLPLFFPRLYGEGKSEENFKINIHLDSIESFLYCLSSSTVVS